MNWKLKALVQQVFSAMPRGEHLNYLFQRHVTKSLPASEIEFNSSVSFAKRHLEAIREHYERPLNAATFYEFGAGWELTIPLAFYALGIERQIIVDIRSLSRPELVNNTIALFGRMPPDPAFQRYPSQHLHGKNGGFNSLLHTYYGIDYRAPCDARRTGIEAGSVDCITSTTALEHIPPSDIHSILNECHRILRSGGLASFLIDYLDHYSYFDPEISNYNYLKYSDRTWKLFNPGLHYQNRLRHQDHMELIQSAGFEILDEQRRDATENELDVLRQINIADRFKSYPLNRLAVRYAFVLVRKRPQ